MFCKSLSRWLTVGLLTLTTSVVTTLPASAEHDDYWRDRSCDRDDYRGDKSRFSFSIRIGSGDHHSRSSVGYEYREYRGYDHARVRRPVYETPCEVMVIKPVRRVYVEPCGDQSIGRWERRWVPARYRYVQDGGHYRRVCVQEGYYSRVWVEGRF